ncbi:MAG: hypothetical protein IPM32_04465 [Ignavibacteriae bacterium]|nr:hypothetical protein [Ignavibacteriota bacterium]
MQKSVFAEVHNHKIENEQFEKYRKNSREKGKRFKNHFPIETFDVKQVLDLVSKSSVVRLGIVQGVDDKGQKISMLAAYNSKGVMVGKGLQTGDPCPPPKCE